MSPTSLAEPRSKAPDASATGLTYRVFDAAAWDFPSPRVPLLPSIGLRAIGMSAPEPYRLVGSGQRKRSYTRGRYALFDAYRLCGVGAEGGLLAPAYHCRTMIDPALRLGGEVLLYRVRPDLAPDFEALRRLVTRASRRVRALLLTHYFGLAQNAAVARAFCDAHGIALIEDCSHALFDAAAEPRLGRHGDFTVASPYKLLPCEEGGLLIPGAQRSLPGPGGRAPRLRAELRVLVDAVDRVRALRARDPATLDTAALDLEVARIAAGSRPPDVERRESREGVSRLYLPEEEGLAGTAASRLLMRLCDVGHAAGRRRANFQQWLDAVRALPHCRPLIGALPDGCVPYMFPLYLEHPHAHFHVLKRLGMPIWRWDDMAESDCSSAMDYRAHLLHLPCHQSLSEADMRWMVAALGKALSQIEP